MKVGDYVRTRDGIILKVKDIEDIYTTDNIYIGMSIYDNEGHFVNDVEIIKSSPNIIDLIEVGDYVNGSKVIKIEEYNDEKYIYVEEMEFCNACNENENVYYKEDTINSILTKEQFENCMYKVGD